jgi:hypothetical protein
MSFKDLRAARAGRHHPSFDPRQHQRSSPSGEGQTGPAELSDLAGTAGIQKVEEARGVLPEQNETEMEVQATGSASGTSRRGLSAEETNELLRLGEHGLEVRDVHGRGRGLFGRKTYRPGEYDGPRSLLSSSKVDHPLVLRSSLSLFLSLFETSPGSE